MTKQEELDIEISKFHEEEADRKKELSVYKSLQVLRETKEYKLVIEEILVQDTSKVLFEQLIAPNYLSVEAKEGILRQIDAIKTINGLLGIGGTIDIEGQIAEEFLKNKESVLEEIREMYT